jgi:cellulose synthase/poly-beta-1,6-N-acetylglucosamine synthase-like glycosyltransferase
MQLSVSSDTFQDFGSHAMLMTSYLSEPIAASLVLFTLPVVTELAVLTVASLFPKRMRVQLAASEPLNLAVVIPAHNEELLIASCVESLRVAAGGDNTRIIAVAHNCSDRTAARAAEAGAEVLLYNDLLAKGKGRALSAGFAYASAQGMDATLVVDADSTVSSNLIGVVRRAISNGAEAVQCRYEMDSSSKRPATRLTALAFRGFNVVRPTGRDRLGLSAGIVGNGFAVRQALLAQNSYDSLSVVEDLEFHIRLVLSGKRVQFLEDAKVSSAMPSSKKGEATQRSRWEGGRANAARTWFVPLLKQLARGRPQMLEPLLELTCLPIGYAVFLILIAGCFPLLWLRIYALVALAVIGGHVLAAAWSGTDFAGDMLILVRAPGYILWKLCMIPSLLRGSRPEAVWVRTERHGVAQEISLETAGDSMPPPAIEHALRMTSSLEIS